MSKSKFLRSNRNKSLSQLVGEYFLLLTTMTEETDPEEELPPITQSLSGVLAGYSIEEEDYHRHLEEKYL